MKPLDLARIRRWTIGVLVLLAAAAMVAWALEIRAPW